MNDQYDWAQHIEHARKLGANADDEGLQRLAIHAAYYGAFNLARQYVEVVVGLKLPSTGDVHQAVWKALDGGNSNEKTAANRGEALRKLRNAADYDSVFPKDLLQAVNRALIDAGDIVKRLPVDEG
jgi:hypothetical protein